PGARRMQNRTEATEALEATAAPWRRLRPPPRGGDRPVPARVQAGEGAHSRPPPPRSRPPPPPPQGGEGGGGGSPPLRIHSMDPSRSAGSGSQRLHDSPCRLRPPVHGPRLRRPRE